MRVIHWLTLAAGIVAIAALFWYMVATPGRSWASALPPLTDEERALRERLRIHVGTIASHEHNIWTSDRLEAAATHLEMSLGDAGYEAQREEYRSGGAVVRNVLAELKGTTRGDEIIVVGAHYDSVRGAPGANDNGSGVAAVLELARALRGWKPMRTWRFALFVNEEPPFFYSGEMGSQVHARHARERNERIVAMFSLETIGYYSDQPGSQHYPFPLSVFYRYPYYHTPQDTPDKVDYERLARVTRALERTFRTLDATL